MIKIGALNEESEEESGSEEEVTKEALEQIALQQYAKALDLQRKGNLTEASQLLRDLLDTELLYEVEKPARHEKATGPLYNLKYLCYKNIGSIEASLDHREAAIDAYCAATDLDDTDVTLWHRLGTICLQNNNFEMALLAFQRGIDRNPRHWPCLDKVVILLFALGHFHDCIAAIHEASLLDPDYLRGIVYKRHIYSSYPYIHDFMKHINPLYVKNESENVELDEEIFKKLLIEAEDISKIYEEQQLKDNYSSKLPDLKLQKPITKLTWISVGESLIHMHNYMSENYFSHACRIQMILSKDDTETPMDVSEEPQKSDSSDVKMDENNIDIEKTLENVSENEINDLSDKAATDAERVESDIEVQPNQNDNAKTQEFEAKEQKKAPVRRRGSALSFLVEWEWCNKRRSGRKKPISKEERSDDSIYPTLRRMVPEWLTLQTSKTNDVSDHSPDTMDLYRLFEEKENNAKEINFGSDEYFGCSSEQADVNNFITKYTENKSDIIAIIKDFLEILAAKWQLKWPDSLSNVFIKANHCYVCHSDVPACTEDNTADLIHFVTVNLLNEELKLNKEINSPSVDFYDISTVDIINLILNRKPHIFTNCMEILLRCLWMRFHILLKNKQDELALDTLYQLQNEFIAMGEHCNTFVLMLENFSCKPIISDNEVLGYIKFLERNKQLSTVMELYNKENFEEVLNITIESFEYCKTLARKQEEEMSLDFGVQLSLILDCHWALGKVEECLKWSFICLHEALKHYLPCSLDSPNYGKWSMALMKVLCCMEHILVSEGLACLDVVPQKDLSQGIEDMIQIIGHQLNSKMNNMPLGTVAPWILMHYILQREDDQGRSRRFSDKEKVASDEIPNSLMILFVAHEQLGARGWCSKFDAKLLYFLLDTVVPRLRSPSLARSLETVCQYMEQCVFCLFGHPSKKTKLKYLIDHNVVPHSLDWNRAQQLYEIYRPVDLPEVEGKVPLVSAETEQLFRRILALIPVECQPQKYIQDLEKYISGKEKKLPSIPPLLPYKMKDIYFLLGDYYFKKEERKMSVKYNMFDVMVNNDRFESWAEIALAMAVNLDMKVNSCNNIDNDKDYLRPVQKITKCFKRALEIDKMHCNLWIEYGAFVYGVHSFCSRLLKQASESLSMEDFASLEQQKEDMLDTTEKCFSTYTLLGESHDQDKGNDETWLYYYMLGKVAEKKNKSPVVYLNYYIKSVKSLQENEAIYPLKINYNSPQYLSIEVLELHYRIHASILKYIEQHENKAISASIGKVFLDCLHKWDQSPFCEKKKAKKEDGIDDTIGESLMQTSGIVKRSISEAGDEDIQESKRMKMEIAAKVRRAVSYDTDCALVRDVTAHNTDQLSSHMKIEKTIHKLDGVEKVMIRSESDSVKSHNENTDIEKNKQRESDKRDNLTKDNSTGNSSSGGSSSGSSSEDSSSESSSDSSAESDTSRKSVTDNQSLSEEEIMSIISACLNALEDCASRFPQHYKALYRLAHYHFYYKKGKDIERCRDLMLSQFMSRANQKLVGLFSDRKPNNFFYGIWRIPIGEVDRPGGFASHMNRSILLTMEILKEIDDHKTLLDLSLQLQRIPEPDKKYLRDSDREELAQQAFSLCIQSLKGQLMKFVQQADLKSNDVEKRALNSLMLDIYRAYMRAQKQPNSKQFTNLLVDGFKLASNETFSENVNLVDLSMRHCQSLIAALKQQATMASLAHSNQNAQKKQVAKPTELAKGTTSNTVPKKPIDESKGAAAVSQVMSPQEMAAALQSYMPILNDPLMTPRTAAALSISSLSNLSTLAGYTALQNTIQSSLQNSYQSEFYRQYLASHYSSYNFPPAKKQKRTKHPTTKPPNVSISVSTLKSQPKGISKSFNSASIAHSSVTKSTAPSSHSISSIISNPTKSTSASGATLSIGTVLSSLPPSMSSITGSFGASVQPAHMPVSISQSQTGQSASSQPLQAHISNTSTVSATLHMKPPLPHQQISPGKTLQEKLAERQKHLPLSTKINVGPGQEPNSSIPKLPSALTITKSSNKINNEQGNKNDAKKSLLDSDTGRFTHLNTPSEIIVLDDDDD